MNCNRPPCTGTIDADGYCEVCGMAPAKAPSSVADPAPSAVTSAIRRPATTRTGTTPLPRAGAGLVAIPPVLRRDPTSALLDNPTVPEEKRSCAKCDAPVGRGRGGRPGRIEGFCPKCGERFSFRPALRPGDMVANQYQIAGCIAHGGLGWIYLARDRNVADRWVALKGLLNTLDEDARAAAIAERKFLAEVQHPNIVKIYNFVEHEDSGYIVMEYVDGMSLYKVLDARRDADDGTLQPLPLAEAISYIYDILPALGHLHSLGLMFCDFKPANVMSTPNGLKLIDLGGVYRLDDPSNAIYGTVGYQAPEIASTGPTVPSDLYTVARSLAVLCTVFKGYQNAYRFSLPPREDVPQYASTPALYRLLERATAPNPDDRFQSADEMAAQLLGLLHQVLAHDRRSPSPGVSTLFTGELHTASVATDWRALPALQVSSDDPAAGFLASLTVVDATELVELLPRAPEPTVEVQLRLARAHLDIDEVDEAANVLDKIAAEDPWEWRIEWYRGLIALQSGAPAQTYFDAVVRAAPGELVPQLAMGFAEEAIGEYAAAAPWYDVVSRTDPSFTSACFGLARCRMASDDREGAVAAYERIPSTSSAYVDAQIAKVAALVDATAPTLAGVTSAAAVVERLPLDGEQRARLTVTVLDAALTLVLVESQVSPDGATVLGCSLNERDVRFGLEAAYRRVARYATGLGRIALVDRANQVRPRTLV